MRKLSKNHLMAVEALIKRYRELTMEDVANIRRHGLWVKKDGGCPPPGKLI